MSPTFNLGNQPLSPNNTMTFLPCLDAGGRGLPLRGAPHFLISVCLLSEALRFSLQAASLAFVAAQRSGLC